MFLPFNAAFSELIRSSAWKPGYQLGRKIAVDLFLYEEQTRWRRWRFFVKFDFYVGITIIVEMIKKVELFPWTGEVQAEPDMIGNYSEM